MNDDLKKNLTSKSQWIRLLYMLFFAACLYIASFVLALIVVIQFVFAIITGSVNPKLKRFSSNLTTYVNQLWLYLSYNSENQPFPFEDFPDEDGEDIIDAEVVEQYDTAEGDDVEDDVDDFDDDEPEEHDGRVAPTIDYDALDAEEAGGEHVVVPEALQQTEEQTVEHETIAEQQTIGDQAETETTEGGDKAEDKTNSL